MKVFLTVEIEKHDTIAETDIVVEMLTKFSRTLRKNKINSQLKFTTIPRRYERERFKPASDI